MAVTNFRKSGFATLGDATVSLITDLLASGMKLVYPSSFPGTGFQTDTTTGQIKSSSTVGTPSAPVARVILESTNAVDVKSSVGFTASAAIGTTTNGAATATLTLTDPDTGSAPTVAPFPVGSLVTINGATSSGYDGTFTVVSTPTAATLTYLITSNIPVGAGTGRKVVAGYGGAASSLTYASSDDTVLNNSWRICFDFPLIDSTATAALATQGTTVFSEFLAVYVGTSVQLRNDGTVIALPKIPTQAGGTITFLEPAGNVGADYRTNGVTTSGTTAALAAAAALKPVVVNGVPTTEGGTVSSWDVGFYNRIGIDRNSGYAVPLTYDLTTSKRGIFFGMYDIYSEQSGTKFNWVLVQRSVDRDTGAIRGRYVTNETGSIATFLRANDTESVAPVWCVNCVNNKYYKFVVREQDLGGPGRKTSAIDNTEDSTAIINPFDQQSLTDDSKYVITFLSNLNTTRFKYPDELDLVGTVSADVIGAGTEAEVNVYNELQSASNPMNRVYRALPPNSPFGTGMRLVNLVRFQYGYTGSSTGTAVSAAGPSSESGAATPT